MAANRLDMPISENLAHISARALDFDIRKLFDVNFEVPALSEPRGNPYKYRLPAVHIPPYRELLTNSIACFDVIVLRVIYSPVSCDKDARASLNPVVYGRRAAAARLGKVV